MALGWMSLVVEKDPDKLQRRSYIWQFEELFGDEKGDNRCFYCYFIQNFVWRVHIPKFPPVILNNYWELQDTVFFPKKKIMGLPSCKTDVKSSKVEKGEFKAFSKNSKVDRLPVLFLFWGAFFGMGKRWYPKVVFLVVVLPRNFSPKEMSRLVVAGYRLPQVPAGMTSDISEVHPGQYLWWCLEVWKLNFGQIDRFGVRCEDLVAWKKTSSSQITHPWNILKLSSKSSTV